MSIDLPARASAPTRSVVIAANAPSISLGPRPLELKLHSQRPGRDVQFAYDERLDWIGRVREDRHTADLGDDLLEQLQLLASDLRADAEGQAL